MLRKVVVDNVILVDWKKTQSSERLEIVAIGHMLHYLSWHYLEEENSNTKSDIGINGLILTSSSVMILVKVKITNDKSKMILSSSKLFYYNSANNNYDNTHITFFL